MAFQSRYKFRSLCVLALPVVFIFIGCATTRIQSLKTHNYHGPFKRILLFVPESNLILRHKIEKNIKKYLSGSDELIDRTFGRGQVMDIKWKFNDSIIIDTIAFVCSEIEPLWDEYSPDRLNFLLSDYGFDATMVVAPEEYWTSSTYIPQMSSTTITPNYISTKTVGGYTISVKHGRYECRVYNFRTNELIWKATAISSSSLLDANIEKSFAKKLVEKLQKDGIIPREKIKVKRDIQ